ncbi:hypothetical protein PVL30_000037 [Lodderomyces elongisporus]|uniref:uncharacterized protein n=1 Tax=Lodderomyces elongisporus TaxID=36914 RepID=UPI00292704A0|nr:uncharacterized protein PVL30_000037 [Lodderomyces elongisporus]WLF76336.1 hypothetical protein PVL30_000037 [Lodderomyces elongisporus]
MNLTQQLSFVLPHNESFKSIYVQSKPVSVKSPILFKKNAQPLLSKPQDTLKIRHFFILVQNDLIILGVEIYTYIQVFDDHIDQYIFVSKCDTTGLQKLNSFKVADVVEVVIKYIINYNISSYKIKLKHKKKTKSTIKESKEVNGTLALIKKLQKRIAVGRTKIPYHHHEEEKEEEADADADDALISLGKSTVKASNLFALPSRHNLRLCLFTKTAPQYLFPNSSKNPSKHNITGQTLLKWWIPIINRATLSWSQHKLLIPGSDTIATAKFIENYPNWRQGHIFGETSDRKETERSDRDMEASEDDNDNGNEIVINNSNQNKDKIGKQDKGMACEPLAVYNIPLFPDDPKGRFLEHLIVENRLQKMTTARFYKELGYRQEFRLGDCVGLIGCSVDDYKYVSNETRPDVGNDNTRKTDLEILKPLVVSVKQYKSFIDLMKSVSYDSIESVQHLVQNYIPEYFLSCGLKHFQYDSIIGLRKVETKSTVDSEEKKRKNIDGVVSQPIANDLTGLIKRRKK